MSKSDISRFKKVFKITNFGLWITGCHPTLPRGWLLRSFMILSICFTCFALLLNSILNHRIPNAEYDDAVREAVMTIVGFTIMCKYMIIVRNRHVILKLFRHMDTDLKSENFSARQREIILEYAKRGLFVTKFWLCSGTSSGTLFIGKAIISTIYYYCKGQVKYVQIFEAKYPSLLENNKNDFFGYIVLSCYLAIFGLYAVLMYIAFDPVVSIFMLHFSGQLEILCLRIENLFSGDNDSDKIRNEIKEINVKLKVIYELIDDVQATFMALLEFTMKTTTLLMPFIVFQIVQALRRDEINPEFLSLLIGTILQFYMPCYYSNFLMDKSEALRRAIYFCGWEKHSNLQIRKIVVFMLTRTSKPAVLQTIFYPLNLETYAESCRQSYALYSIMNAVWT